MPPGVIIVPSDMGQRAVLGMHGYSPSDPASDACLYSSAPLPSSLARIEQLFGLMIWTFDKIWPSASPQFFDV
jgi:hypothetical protein